MPRKGLGGARTLTPAACRVGITPAQFEASAKAPCTSTTVSGPPAALGVASVMAFPSWVVTMDDRTCDGAPCVASRDIPRPARRNDRGCSSAGEPTDGGAPRQATIRDGGGYGSVHRVPPFCEAVPARARSRGHASILRPPAARHIGGTPRFGEPVWGWGTEENSSDARRRESAEVVADRKDRRRRARVDVDLLHHMLDMIAGRALADRQRRGDLAIAQPLCQQAQDLDFARRQTEQVRLVRRRRCRNRGRRQAQRWPSPRRPPPARATPRRWPTRPRTRPPLARRGRRRHHARGQPGRPGRPAARWPRAAPPPPRRGGRRAPVAPRRWQGQPYRPAPWR